MRDGTPLTEGLRVPVVVRVEVIVELVVRVPVVVRDGVDVRVVVRVDETDAVEDFV